MSSNFTTESTSTKWLQQMGSAIALLDNEFNFVAATDSWHQNFSFDKNSSRLKGKSILSIFPDYSEDLKTRLEYALDGLKDIQLMYRGNTVNCGSKDCIWFLNPWKDGYGNTIGVAINVKEVSERKSLELDLKRTKHLFEQKNEIAKIGSWEYDAIHNRLFWSDMVKDIYGVYKEYKPEYENAFSFYMEGESKSTIRQVFKEAIENAKPWNETVQLIASDGNIKWVNSIGRPKFKDGQCTRILGTLQVVQQPKELTVTIPPEDPFDYPAIFENAPTALAFCDLETGNILGSNQALQHVLGVNEIDLKDKPISNFLSLDKALRLSLAREILSKKSFGPVKSSFVRKGGEPMIIELKGKLLEKKDGQKLILASIERSQEVVVERCDSQALDADLEIDKLIHFNHMVSHNLKGHATNISLLLNFVDKEIDTMERKNMMKLLFQSTDYLMNEIKGLREMVAIGENKGLKKVTVPLNDFIFSAEQKLSGQIKKEKVKIFNGIEDSLKVNVVPVYMDSILQNILSNSIKFKQDDKNPVVVFNTTETDEYVILSIEDNGIGIDLSKHKDKIFGLYRTINSSTSSGMGLYLAKYQMELMCGKIEVESQIDVGTTFKLFLPKN